MKSNDFVAKLKDIATNYETLYVYGCFGACLKESNKARYTTNSPYEYNKRPEVLADINKAVQKGNVFGFDCVCLLKGVLWGWNGNKSATYGGAVYKSNNVPDYNADRFFNTSSDISTDFSKIEIGEAVWTNGHIGVYIGDGLAVECTPSWDNKVQITAVGNIGSKSGYNTRTWLKHGKLPYIDYENKFLSKGDKGTNVKKLQEALVNLGYSCGSSGIDGAFGSGTLTALNKYQADNGLVKTDYVTKELFDEITNKTNPKTAIKQKFAEIEKLQKELYNLIFN